MHFPGQAADPYSFFGFSRGSASIRARWAENRMIGDTSGTLAVDLDGIVIGDVDWHVVSYGPPPMSNAFNFGIRILPAYQGPRATAPTLRSSWRSICSLPTR